mgnify:FL=1
MTEDEKYIRRCIQLASNGLCTAAPNPMVGAVVVCDGKIIGEGYHVHCGEGHAEVNAIGSVKDKSLLKRSTIYVSLEPCSHYGKTPPCADLILRMGIPRVVVGCVDPFSLVAGRGIQKLRDGGVEVTVGVLEQECRDLIRRFVVFNTQKRPYITLKWAQSADGFIDVRREGGSAKVLSTPISSLYVHKQRAEHKAILVGRNTALLDNPSLTVRGWSGANPIRMVIDRNLTLPSDLHLFDGSQTTWVFTQQVKESTPYIIYHTLDFTQDILPQICKVLYDNKVQSVLVEGGTCLLQSFIDKGLWDEIFIEHARCVLKDGVPAPIIPHGVASDFELRDGVFTEHYRQLNYGV